MPQDPKRPMPDQPSQNPEVPLEAPQRTTPRKEEINPQAGKPHGDSCGC